MLMDKENTQNLHLDLGCKQQGVKDSHQEPYQHARTLYSLNLVYFYKSKIQMVLLFLLEEHVQ